MTNQDEELHGLYVAYDALQTQLADVTSRADEQFRKWKSTGDDDARRRYEFRDGMQHALMLAKSELQQLIAARGGVVGELADDEDWRGDDV